MRVCSKVISHKKHKKSRKTKADLVELRILSFLCLFAFFVAIIFCGREAALGAWLNKCRNCAELVPAYKLVPRNYLTLMSELRPPAATRYALVT